MAMTKKMPEEKTVKAAAEEVAEPKVKRKPKDIDIHQSVTVKNGFQGDLIYQSKRTGEVFEWKHFGDEQEMELCELKNVKSSEKAFFENNWFMFDDEFSWVIDWLDVGKYYKKALKIDDFDDVFTKTPEEITEIISGLSRGQKASLAYRARQVIADGGIDSIKAISALEDGLGVELIER